MSTVTPASHSGRYSAWWRSRYCRSAVGWLSSSPAQRESQSTTTATSARTVEPATSPIASQVAPSSTTSRQTRLSVPACGSSAEWNFSAPARDARHWKKQHGVGAAGDVREAVAEQLAREPSRRCAAAS